MSVLSALSALFAPSSESSAGDDEQTELSRIPGTIWHAVLQADASKVLALCEHDPSVLRQRGPVGETPTLMCFLYNSPKHIQLAHWIMDRYERETADEAAVHPTVHLQQALH